MAGFSANPRKRRPALGLAALLALSLCCAAFAESGNDEDEQEVVIHVMSHSHDDVGWLRTPDEYYEQEVQYILDSVTEQLLANKERKYIQVEVAFFRRWWEEQGPERREQFAGLVREGRVEFVLGGWVMPDEATTYGPHLIDTLTYGHAFLRETFGVVPRHAWHIDPFGASLGVAALYAAAGFGRGFVINRIDFRQKEQWAARRQLQFLWRTDPAHAASPSGPADAGASDGTVFAHLLDSHYCTPEGFEWEHGVNQNVMGGGAGNGDGDTPIVVKAPSAFSAANAAERAEAFVALARARAASYRTPHILIPFGCDFSFQNALMKYKNMDRLIKHINENSASLRARAQYSTLSDFFDAVHAWRPPAPTPAPAPAPPPEPEPEPAPAPPAGVSDARGGRPAFPSPAEPRTPSDIFPTLTDQDFYPYADGPAAYWTGYFASHGALKALVRKAGAVQRAAEGLFVLATWAKGYTGEAPERIAADREAGYRLLDFGRDAIATAQHHDGVTGTSMARVVDDYKTRLWKGIASAKEVANEGLAHLWALLARDEAPPAAPAPALPAPASALRGKGPAKGGAPAHAANAGPVPGVPIVVYNSLAHARTAVVEVKLARADVAGVLDAAGKAVPWQLSRDPFAAPGAPAFRLHFLARDVAPLGYETHFATFGGSAGPTPHEPVPRGAAPFEIKGDRVRVTFDPRTGLSSELRRDGLQFCLGFRQEFVAFVATEDRQQPSGAYIFRPGSPRPERLPGPPRLLRMRGPLLDEVVQIWPAPYGIVQATRVYRGVPETAVELEALIPPPPPDAEVVTRIATDDGAGGHCGPVDSRDSFETDANGLRMVRRRRNVSPVYPTAPGEAAKAAGAGIGGRPGDADAGVSVAGNFYPATVRAGIRDEHVELSLLTRRAVAAASLAPGALEALVARRLARDDFRGVQEPLNDTAPVHTRQWVLAEPTGASPLAVERAALALEYPLLARFGPGVPDVKSYAERHLASLSFRGALARALPPALHLLSFHAAAPQRPRAPGEAPRGWQAAVREAGLTLAAPAGPAGAVGGPVDVHPGEIRSFLVTFAPAELEGAY
eukprot:tig00020911_g15738.t1